MRKQVFSLAWSKDSGNPFDSLPNTNQSPSWNSPFHNPLLAFVVKNQNLAPSPDSA